MNTKNIYNFLLGLGLASVVVSAKVYAAQACIFDPRVARCLELAFQFYQREASAACNNEFLDQASEGHPVVAHVVLTTLGSGRDCTATGSILGCGVMNPDYTRICLRLREIGIDQCGMMADENGNVRNTAFGDQLDDLQTRYSNEIEACLRDGDVIGDVDDSVERASKATGQVTGNQSF